MKQNNIPQKEEVKNGINKEAGSLVVSLNTSNAIPGLNMNIEKPKEIIPYFNSSEGGFGKKQSITTNDIENKEIWNEQEELNMIIAHNKYKNKWSEMGTMLKGKSNNTIKNKFYSIFRRIKGKILKKDYSYESKLELLEIYYIISLMEYYLLNPDQNQKAKGKRGKDFIYSLIHNLNKAVVEEYKATIEKLAKNEGTLDDLFKELVDNYASPPPVTSQPQVVAQEEIPKKPSLPTMQMIEPMPAIKTHIHPVQYERDPLLGHIRMPEYDGFLNAESDFISPGPLFSPPPLSAGPAAAAGTLRSSRFADNGGCFGDISIMVNRTNEERLKLRNNHLSFDGTYNVGIPHEYYYQ